MTVPAPVGTMAGMAVIAAAAEPDVEQPLPVLVTCPSCGRRHSDPVAEDGSCRRCAAGGYVASSLPGV